MWEREGWKEGLVSHKTPKNCLAVMQYQRDIMQIGKNLIWRVEEVNTKNKDKTAENSFLLLGITSLSLEPIHHTQKWYQTYHHHHNIMQSVHYVRRGQLILTFVSSWKLSHNE